MKIISVQIGKPQTFGKEGVTRGVEKEWTSGIQKEQVTELVVVRRTNLEGDAQADLRVHGGPDKAICLYPSEHFAYWKKELDLNLSPGGFGENFTTEGMLESVICIGDIFRVGSALVQVSQPRQPCWKLARRWEIKELPARVQETGRTGWYFRVIEEGEIKAADAFILDERPEPSWTVEEANAVMHHRKKDWKAAAELATCVGLSESWRETLSRRVDKNTVENPSARLSGDSEIDS